MTQITSPGKPGKLWYAYQYTAGFLKACFQYPTKSDGVTGAKNTAIGLGTLYAGHMIVAPLLAGVAGAFVPLVVSLASSVVGIHFCIKAFQHFSHVAKSPNVYGEVYRAESKWRDGKQKKMQVKDGLFKRVAAAFKKAVSRAPAPVDTRHRTQGPISKGIVFEGRDKSVDLDDTFNDTAVPPAAPANNNKPPAAPKKQGNAPKGP